VGGMEIASRPTMVASEIKYILVVQYVRPTVCFCKIAPLSGFIYSFSDLCIVHHGYYSRDSFILHVQGVGGMEDVSRPTLVASAIKYILVIQYIVL
jgi:hypothetical protein